MDTVEVETRVKCMDIIHAISAGNVSETGLDEIAQLPHGPRDGQFCTVLNRFLLKLEGDPIFSMLELKLNPGETLANLFKAIKFEEVSKHLRSKVKSNTKMCIVHLLWMHEYDHSSTRSQYYSN